MWKEKVSNDRVVSRFVNHLQMTEKENNEAAPREGAAGESFERINAQAGNRPLQGGRLRPKIGTKERRIDGNYRR